MPLSDTTARPAPLGPRALITALVLAWCWLLLHGPLLDLQIYRMGARSLLDGHDRLYAVADPVSGLQFTYSPFAALLFTPLAVLPVHAAALLITGLSVIALMRCVQLVTSTLRISRAARKWLPYSAFLLEPVISTLSFGQINLILLWLVLEDLHRPGRRGSGIAIGLAAGIKVVPGIWILFLVLQGRFRSARTAALTAAGTALLGWLLLPGSSAAYFFGGALDPQRTGGVAYLANQSITGVVARLAGPSFALDHWRVITVAVLILGSTVVIRCLRSGRATESMMAMALTGLLASPVSWSHHWVWLLPIIAFLLTSGRPLLASAWIGVTCTWIAWWAPAGHAREQSWTWWQQLCGNAYVALAMISLVALLVPPIRHPLGPGRVPPPGRQPGRRRTPSRGVARPDRSDAR